MHVHMRAYAFVYMCAYVYVHMNVHMCTHAYAYACAYVIIKVNDHAAPTAFRPTTTNYNSNEIHILDL